jgi:hypothetical protein
MFGGLFGESSRLKFEGFAAKLLEGFSVLLGEAADFHNLVSVYRQSAKSWLQHRCGRKPVCPQVHLIQPMIRKLKTGQYRLYSSKKNPKTGRRRNLGTFSSRAAAQKHERAVQYFKRA